MSVKIPIVQWSYDNEHTISSLSLYQCQCHGEGYVAGGRWRCLLDQGCLPVSFDLQQTFSYLLGNVKYILHHQLKISYIYRQFECCRVLDLLPINQWTLHYTSLSVIASIQRTNFNSRMYFNRNPKIMGCVWSCVPLGFYFLPILVIRTFVIFPFSTHFWSNTGIFWLKITCLSSVWSLMMVKVSVEKYNRPESMEQLWPGGRNNFGGQIFVCRGSI